MENKLKDFKREYNELIKYLEGYKTNNPLVKQELKVIIKRFKKDGSKYIEYLEERVKRCKNVN